MKPARALIATALGISLMLSGLTAALAADLRGEYRLDPAASDDVKPVIDKVVASMNFITRPIARSRLAKGTKAAPTVEIAYDEREIVVTFEPKNPVRMPSSGATVSWTREDGETFQVNAQWKGAELSQTFKASDGDRNNVFRLDPSGDKLLMLVTLSSPQLPAPVQYTLVYRRR
jgi:hypothetical protein